MLWCYVSCARNSIHGISDRKLTGIVWHSGYNYLARLLQKLVYHADGLKVPERKRERYICSKHKLRNFHVYRNEMTNLSTLNPEGKQYENAIYNKKQFAKR